MDKTMNTADYVNPFVCGNRPFVSSEKYQIIPFISNNVPFIGIKHSQRGFTIIELMITLVVISLLAGVGIPGFRNFILNSRITTQSNDLVGELAIARSEAIKRNTTVVLCRSANPTATTPTCSTGSTGSKTWESGWLVFQDANGDKVYTTAGGDTLLRVHEAITGGNTLRGSDTELGDYLAFTRDGVTTLTVLAAGVTAHHFKVCDSRGAGNARAILLEPTGRARIDRLSTFSSLTCP
jgi:type IV fimbrial biogenesis protein FimT